MKQIEVLVAQAKQSRVPKAKRMVTCKVTDNDSPPLTKYRRIVAEIE